MWRRKWQPTPVLLPGKSHGQRSLVGCSPWGHEESDSTERLDFHFSPSCIGEGNGNPLQCSCLENPRDRGAQWAALYGVAQSRTRLRRLSSSSSSMFLLLHRLVLLPGPSFYAFFIWRYSPFNIQFGIISSKKTSLVPDNSSSDGLSVPPLSCSVQISGHLSPCNSVFKTVKSLFFCLFCFFGICFFTAQCDNKPKCF